MNARFSRLSPFALGALAVLVIAACTQRDESRPARDERPDRTSGQATTPAGTRAAAVPPDPSADMVIAEVAGQTITLGALDADLADELARQRAQYEAALFEARSNALDQKVNDVLLRAEAERRSTSIEALLDEEIGNKVAVPGNDELLAFYEEYRHQMEGASFDQMRDRIAEYLVDTKRQERQRDLMAELRKRHGAKVHLTPPRTEVEATGPSKGPANARIALVIFSDFECPFCARAVPALDEVERTYPNDVRFYFRHSPLPFHQAARPAHEASSCAGEQERFWQVHDHIFATGQLGLDQLRTFVATLSGFDLEAYDACMSSGRGARVVESDLAAAQAAQVDGTPAFFINGIKISGAQPFAAFQDVIEAELQR